MYIWFLSHSPFLMENPRTLYNKHLFVLISFSDFFSLQTELTVLYFQVWHGMECLLCVRFYGLCFLTLESDDRLNWYGANSKPSPAQPRRVFRLLIHLWEPDPVEGWGLDELVKKYGLGWGSLYLKFRYWNITLYLLCFANYLALFSIMYGLLYH